MSELNALVRHLYIELGLWGGGPLHVVLDDGNLDDEFIDPASEAGTFAYLWDGQFEKYADPGERVDVEFKSDIETTCRKIMVLLRAMPLDDRRVAVHAAWRAMDDERERNKWSPFS